MGRRARLSHIMLLLATLLLVAGCPRPGAQPAGPPAFGPDLRAAPAPNSLDAAWELWFSGNTADATTAMNALATSTNPPPLALFGQAELAIHQAQLQHGVSRHLELLESAADAPFAQWSAARVWELREYYPDWAEHVLRVADALEGQRLDPQTRALLGLSRATAEYQMQLRDPNPKLWDGAADGFAQQWTMAGPFSIYPFLDEDTAFSQVEDAPSLSTSYTLGGMVHKSRALVLDQPEFNPSFSVTGIYYAETWLSLPEDTEVLIQFHSGSSQKVWLGEQLLFERTLLDGYPTALFGAHALLKKGVHRIRVRLAVQNDREPFVLLFTPTSGKRAAFTFSGSPPTTQPKTSQTAQLIEPNIFEGLSNDTANGHPFLLWLKAQHALNAGLYHHARQTLEALSALAPQFSPAPFMMGNAFRHDPTLAASVQDEQALQLYRKSTSLDPLALFASDRLAFLLYSKEQLTEALTILDRLLQQVPGEYIIQYHRYLIFKERGWVPQMRESLQRALDKFPTNCTLIAAQWEVWLELESYPKPDALPQEFFGCDITHEHLANHYDIPKGDLTQAIARYERLAALNPSTHSYLSTLARLYERSGDAVKAARAYKTIRAHSTASTIVDLQQFDATLAQKGPDAGRDFLDQRLNVRKGDFYLLRQRARLDAENILEDLRVDGMDLIKSHLAAPVGTNNSAFYLLDYAATRVFPDGSNLTLTHIIVRVHNKEGIDAFGEVDLPEDALVLAIRTVKPDGRALEPEMIFGKPSLSMPNLEPGDFIEYEYISSSSASLIREGSFVGFRFFFNILDAPMQRSEYLLEVPQGWELQFDLRNNAPTPTLSTQGDGSLRYTLTALDAPRGVQEESSVQTAEYLPSAQAYHRYTWLDLHKTYRDKLMINLRPSPELRAQVVKLRQGRATQREIAKAIFDFALEEISDDSSGPFAQSASHVLSSRVGDRLTLISTMLSIAEINNEIILARTLSSDLTDSVLPTIDPWGFPLLLAKIDGKDVWLDPGVNHARFDYIPPATQGGKGLRMGHINTAQDEAASVQALFIDIPDMPAHQERREIVLELSVDTNGHTTGMGTESYHGSSAILLRRILDQYTDPKEFEQALAQSMASSFPGLELQDLTIRDRTDPEKPLTLNYTFTSTGFARKEGEALVIERTLFPTNFEASFASLPERKTVLSVLDPIEMNMTTRVVFPKGYTCTSTTSPLELSTTHGRFVRGKTVDGNESVFTRTLSVPPQRIAPEQYTDFKTLARRIDKGEELSLSGSPSP